MKHVRALLLGGSTIADQVDASGKRRRTDLAEYIRSMHEFDGNIEISIVAREDIAAGYDMQIPDVLEIVREVRKAIDEDQADGVVIVMGTDCMEEAAFAFETLLQTDVPVVVTGAMRVAPVRGAPCQSAQRHPRRRFGCAFRSWRCRHPERVDSLGPLCAEAAPVQLRRLRL